MNDTHRARDGDVRAEDLSYDYGGFRAVDGVSLYAKAGETFALLGTNGAGKTTTLELLQGYRVPDAGTVSVLGCDPVRQGRRLRRRTGFMLQDAGFVPELTVLETVRLWRQVCSRPDEPHSVLEKVELSHREDIRVSRLSGGERRRLDVALAVWGRPELVVLDEPTAGLDPESRATLWTLVRELRDGGSTVLLTTHYLEEAEDLADRIAIMHQGRVAVAGTLDEVLRLYPATIEADLHSGAAEGLPSFTGTATCIRSGEEVRLTVRTRELQRDLAALLAWADLNNVGLHGLRAQSATLENLFHAVRTQDERAAR